MVQIILDEDRGAYEAFIAKLTDALAPKLVAMMKKPPQTVCSQREAYRRYGTGNVRRWVKEGRLKPFAKRPGKIEYKISDLKTLFNQQQDYFSSYVLQNTKNIYKAKKPLWMQCLLFNIMPDLYDPRPSKEECQKNMKAILSAINGQKYYWHQHHSMIGKFCKLVICDDYIKIMSKKGNLMLSFVIEQCEDDELNVN